MNAKALTIAMFSLLLASAGVSAAPAAAGHAGTSQSHSAPLQGSTIIGSQEMPRGMVIMPWRSSRPQSLKPGAPRVLDEPLTPIDPRTFRREVHYYDRLHAGDHSRNRDETNSDH